MGVVIMHAAAKSELGIGSWQLLPRSDCSHLGLEMLVL